jgi:hypothetical protein
LTTILIVVITSNMKAQLLFKRRAPIAENAFADLVIWHLPQPVPGSRHFFKYRLAFVVDGVCVLRYDNEAGKGDHRHCGDEELAYEFPTPSQLLADFHNDITRWRNEHGDN